MSRWSSSSGLLSAFPVLKRLGEPLFARRIPIVQQTTATDCGAASLTMVLGYFGRHVELDVVREGLAVGRDGVTARAIVEAAALHGLRGRGVRIEVNDLALLEPGAILHWEFSHFVVFDRVERGRVHLVDPAFGRRSVSLDEAGRSFTGVALVFETTTGFLPSGKEKNPIWRHLKQAIKGSRDWGRIAVTSILMQTLGLLLPLIHGRLIDRAIPRDDAHLLVVLLSAFIVTALFHFIASVTRSQLFLHLRTRFDAKLTLGFVDHMLRLPYAFFERRQSADLQMRIGSVATIREALTGVVLSGAVDSTLVVGHLLFLVMISVHTTLVALAILCAQAMVFLVSRRKIAELSAGSVAKQAEAANSLNELLAGMESLKASGVEHRASQRWAGQYVDVMNISLRRGNVSAFSDAVLETLQIVGPTVLLIVGVMEVMSGKMSLGTMLSANALAVGFMHPMMSLIGTLQQMQMVRVHLNRIDDVLGTAPEQQDEQHLRAAPPLRGDVLLDRVSFRYGPQLPLVVKNVTVHVRPGECIAIVGRSGSGKTTLGRLLLGLYAPVEGAVALDGMPLKQLDLRSVRRQLGVVVQKPHIFGTTIRANVALGDATVPLERVMHAAKTACIHDDIARMPLQYDTPVVAGGSSLSGGQRQRIALARALVHGPAILLLDEATSALDALTEKAVQDALAQLSCTRILIAHRLSTVVNADRILVMEEGALVEQGTHEELLARGGTYARLVEAQLGSSGERPIARRASGAELAHRQPSQPYADPRAPHRAQPQAHIRPRAPMQPQHQERAAPVVFLKPRPTLAPIPANVPLAQVAAAGYGRAYDPDGPTFDGDWSEWEP